MANFATFLETTTAQPPGAASRIEREKWGLASLFSGPEGAKCARERRMLRGSIIR